MVENVALTKKKQRSFSKLVAKTKDKIKQGDIEVAETTPKPIRKSFKGIVYVSNIPHGFYENEMKDYFGQFGKVLKVRVARSKRTGNSKGHAFVLFKDKEVAKIAAETMNNYLMGKRLIKAKYQDIDEKTKGIFKKPNYSKERYPTMVRRLKFKKSFNAPVSEEKHKNTVAKVMKRIKNVTEKLKQIGIDYDFTPVHIPKSLTESKKKEDIADDSSSEDIVFTSPEEMKKKEAREKKLKKTMKRKGSENIDAGSPKKTKKVKNNKINNTDIGTPEKKLKKNKKNKMESNERTPTKAKKQKKQNKNKTVEKNDSTPTKGKKISKNKLETLETKQKNKNLTNGNIKTTPTKNKKKENKNQKKSEITENNTNENTENTKKEKRKNEIVDKTKTILAVKKDKKKTKNKDGQGENKSNKHKKLNNKIVGVTKKSKKAQKPSKLSDKKADLIKEQIKASDQVKTIKKIEKKNSPAKKKKTKKIIE